jgi:uncharacterized protein YbjT (DUF2867 family)
LATCWTSKRSARRTRVTGAYFCNPIAPGLLEATALFAQAAVDATSHAAQHHWIAERLLDRTPMPRTCGPRSSPSGSTGTGPPTAPAASRLPVGARRHAPLAGEDQAYVIAALLENPEPHDRKICPLVGPVEMNRTTSQRPSAAPSASPCRWGRRRFR